MIGGSDYFGKCDQVPGECHVVTRFLHVCWFPFVPRDSWIILERESASGRRQSIPIARNWRSIRWAWFRAVFYLFLIESLLLLIMTVDNEFGWNFMEIRRQPNATVIAPLIVQSLVALVSFAILRWSYRSSSAGPARLEELNSLCEQFRNRKARQQTTAGVSDVKDQPSA